MSDQILTDGQEKIKAMEAKIEALEAELKEHAEMMKAKAHEEAEEARLDMRKDAERLYKDLTPIIEKCKEHREEAVREVRYHICEHPGFTLALAFGAGLLVARLLEDKIEHCEHHHHHL